MLAPCPKALHGARIGWTSDFDSWELLSHCREYSAQQATRTSYLLAKTEEHYYYWIAGESTSNKGVTSYRNCYRARTCGSNSEICEK